MSATVSTGLLAERQFISRFRSVRRDCQSAPPSWRRGRREKQVIQHPVQVVDADGELPGTPLAGRRPVVYLQTDAEFAAERDAEISSRSDGLVPRVPRTANAGVDFAEEDVCHPRAHPERPEQDRSTEVHPD